MPLLKSENEAIRKLLLPNLKEKFLVKTFVRVGRVHSKLKTEEVLSPEEISVKHPFHPDIDVLFWEKEYSGEPNIRASEVKYFRLKNGVVYPTIYEGLGEALMLLTYGVDSVCLWHLFDPEIPSETVSRYRDLTENLVSGTLSPINYQSWLLPEIPTKPSNQKPPPKDYRELLIGILEAFSGQLFVSSVGVGLKSNPIRYRWDAKILRSIIKKGFRIINK